MKYKITGKIEDKCQANMGFTISWLKYLEKNRKNSYNKLLDLYIKEFEADDFMSFPKDSIEDMIDKATGFDKKRGESFRNFVVLVYENMWENKHNDFFNKLEK